MSNNRLMARGLNEDNIHKATLSTKDGEIVFSNPPVPNSRIQPVMKEVSTLDELKNLVTTNTGEAKKLLKSVSPSEEGALTALAGGPAALSGNQFSELRSAISGFLTGANGLQDAHKENIEKAYGPFRVALYNAENIEVYPGHNLVIKGNEVSIVTINKLDLYPGGEIHITSPNVTVEIDEFEKHSEAHPTTK
jgi:hypothetical protein